MREEVLNNRLKGLALGGCTIHYISEELSEHIQFKHYWRHNIVCDMSDSLSDYSFDIDHDSAARFLEKSAKKILLKAEDKGDFDCLLMECASDYAFKFIKVKNSILPDVRNQLFEQGWENISFDNDKELRAAQEILPVNTDYWDIWKSSFARMYEAHLKCHIDNGKKIFFIKRFLCTKSIVEDDYVDIDHGILAEMNKNLKMVYKYVSKFKGVILIDVPENLHVTSEFAPWGGPWEMHPDQQYFDYVGHEILKNIDVASATAYQVSKLLERNKERVKVRMQFDRSVGEVEALNERLAFLNTQLKKEAAEAAQARDMRAKLEADVRRLQYSIKKNIEARGQVLRENEILGENLRRLDNQLDDVRADKDRIFSELQTFKKRFSWVIKLCRWFGPERSSLMLPLVVCLSSL